MCHVEPLRSRDDAGELREVADNKNTAGRPLFCFRKHHVRSIDGIPDHAGSTTYNMDRSAASNSLVGQVLTREAEQETELLG